MELCNIDGDDWERVAQDWKSWCKLVHIGASGNECCRISDEEAKRHHHKSVFNQIYSYLAQTSSSPVHSVEESFIQELGLLAIHGNIINREM